MPSVQVSIEDFNNGLDFMVREHTCAAMAKLSEEERFTKAVGAMATADFDKHELRGMLAVAIERLSKHG